MAMVVVMDLPHCRLLAVLPGAAVALGMAAAMAELPLRLPSEVLVAAFVALAMAVFNDLGRNANFGYASDVRLVAAATHNFCPTCWGNTHSKNVDDKGEGDSLHAEADGSVSLLLDIHRHHRA